MHIHGLNSRSRSFNLCRQSLNLKFNCNPNQTRNDTYTYTLSTSPSSIYCPIPQMCVTRLGLLKVKFFLKSKYQCNIQNLTMKTCRFSPPFSTFNTALYLCLNMLQIYHFLIDLYRFFVFVFFISFLVVVVKHLNFQRGGAKIN